MDCFINSIALMILLPRSIVAIIGTAQTIVVFFTIEHIPIDALAAFRLASAVIFVALRLACGIHPTDFLAIRIRALGRARFVRIAIAEALIACIRHGT